MTPKELLAVMPGAGRRVEIWAAPLTAAMDRFEINTRQRKAAFLSQIAHESACLTRLVENLNYSPEGILATFNTPRSPRFTKTDAYRYGRTAEHPANQEMIANIAYAGRMGNGPMESGDGWRYRGRGPGQLTGKSNYARCGAALGIDLLSRPELIELPAYGAMAFGWYWVEGNPRGIDLNTLADRGDIVGISLAVNGGDNGIEKRIALFQAAQGALA